MRKLIMIFMLMISTMSYAQNGVIRAYAYAMDGKKVRSEAFISTDTIEVFHKAINNWTRELPSGTYILSFGSMHSGKKFVALGNNKFKADKKKEKKYKVNENTDDMYAIQSKDNGNYWRYERDYEAEGRWAVSMFRLTGNWGWLTIF